MQMWKLQGVQRHVDGLGKRSTRTGSHEWMMRFGEQGVDGLSTFVAGFAGNLGSQRPCYLS